MKSMIGHIQVPANKLEKELRLRMSLAEGEFGKGMKIQLSYDSEGLIIATKRREMDKWLEWEYYLIKFNDIVEEACKLILSG